LGRFVGRGKGIESFMEIFHSIESLGNISEAIDHYNYALIILEKEGKKTEVCWSLFQGLNKVGIRRDLK